MTMRQSIYWVSSLLIIAQILTFNHAVELVQERKEPRIPVQPLLPLSFEATIQITADLLPHGLVYPYRYKFIRILYDFPNKRAKATIIQTNDALSEQIEDVITTSPIRTEFIRRYDEKNDYSIRTIHVNDDDGTMESKCQRSYLGEDMPPPSLPVLLSLGNETITIENKNIVEVESNCASQRDCEHASNQTLQVKHQHWVHDVARTDERIHVYFDADGVIPKSAIYEEVDETTGIATKLMTYEFLRFQLMDGGIDSSEFTPPDTVCERFIIGFPYLNLFHNYLKV